MTLSQTKKTIHEANLPQLHSVYRVIKKTRRPNEMVKPDEKTEPSGRQQRQLQSRQNYKGNKIINCCKLRNGSTTNQQKRELITHYLLSKITNNINKQDPGQ